MTDKFNGRQTPPDGDDEWRYIWAALDKALKAYTIAAPFYAVVSNWKALLVVAGILMALNGPEVIEILERFYE